MKKVMIIGSPGAGKSTFARKLRDVTGLPLFYLDMLWHKPDQTTISKVEFDQKLQSIIENEQWIIDGNYLRTLEWRLAACDTVFLLDYPLEVCLSGVESRIGQAREDLPWQETVFDPEFKQWIIDFEKDQLPQIKALLDQYQETKEIIVFKTRAESEKYLHQTLIG